MKNNILLIIIVAMVVGALGFYAGTQYRGTRFGMTTGQFPRNNGNGQMMRRFGSNGTGRAVRGQIESVDSKSLTVKTSDGGSRLVFYSGGTNISQATAAATADLQAGKDVVVFGNLNADGSVTAQSIQLNPSLPTTTR